MTSLSFGSHEIDISRSNTPLHIKFALICLHKIVIPKWLGTFFFILSHLQVFAIIVKTAYVALPDNTPNASPVVKLFVKLFVLGDWWTHDDTARLLAGTLVVSFYVTKTLILMIYIHVCLFRKYQIPSMVQSYWSLIHKLHPLLIFFWIHTFNIEIIKYYHNYDDFSKPRGRFMTVMAYLNTVITCILAAYFSVISVVYKTKDVLSSKTSILETKAVAFKIIIPALWGVAENNKGTQALILVLNLVQAISHDWIFIRYLPYYRIKILLVNAIFQAIQTSLALVSFILKLVEANSDIGIFSVQIVFLMVAPIFMKLYLTETWKTLLYIFGCQTKNEKNVYYLVHKRFILLYFLKSRKAIHAGITQYSSADIMYQARLAEVAAASESTTKELDKNKKLLVRSLKSICLEILTFYPRALLAQINLANSFSHFEDLYLVSNNLLADAISKGPGYQAQTSLSLIHFELQKRLRIQFSQNSEDGLNVYSFIQNQDLHEEMKKNIEKQAKVQLSFWNEFTSTEPKMLRLVNIALQVHSQRRIIKKLWNSLSKIRPISFVAPLTIYGMYSSFINNNQVEGAKCIQQSQEETKRVSKTLKADELTNDTIFSDKSVKITMSGLRSSLGKVIDCSSNIADFYGWQGNDVKGRSVGSLMPPFFRQRHDGFLLNHFNTGKTRILNKTLVVPVKRSNGYIHASWIHAKVSPFMENGIFYVGILKPCKSSQRMILVREDGKIDDMSFEFAKDMSITRDYESNIFTLCPQFKEINEAFNLIAKESVIIDNNKNNEALSLQNDLVINAFQLQSSGNKKDLLVSERNLAQAETTPRIIETPLLNSFTTRRNNINKQFETSLNKVQAQSIYDKFTAGSTTLSFYPQNTPEPIIYNTKILNSIHGKDVVKYVLLEKEGDEENFSDQGDKETFSSLKFVTNKLNNDHLRTETLASPKAFHETERAELMRLNTSSRATKTRTQFKFSEGIEETNWSVIDEVQDFDSAAIRTAVNRKFLQNQNDNLPSLPSQTQNTAFFTEPNPSPKRKSHFTFENFIQHNPSLENYQTRLSRLKKNLKDPIRNVAEIEKSVSSSYVSKGKKVEQMVVRTLTTKPKKKSAQVFISLAVLFLIIMMILIVLQNINLRAGVRDVQTQIPVMQFTQIRQYAMIYSVSLLLQWQTLIEGFWVVDWAVDNVNFPSWIIYYTEMMSLYNSEFYQAMANLPEKMQKKFYEKNVGIYDYDENRGKTLVSMGSTFEAYQLIIEKEHTCFGTQIPPMFTPNIDTSNFRFAINNALNDLLIQSENQIAGLAQDLYDSTSSTTLKTSITLVVVILVCLIFIIIAARYLWLIASEARIFMTLLFRIKLQECETIQIILQHFISALAQEDLVRPQEKAKIVYDTNDNSRMRFRKASMTGLLRTQRIAFLKFLPIFILFVFWSILSFFLTSNFMADIKDTQRRMRTGLEAFSTQGLLAHEMLAIPLTNAKSLIRNEPILTSYRKSLNERKNFNQFVNKFRDRNGKLTALQEKILFGFPCEDFLPYMARSQQSYDDYVFAYYSCQSLAKGGESISLVYVYSEFYNNARFLLEQYEESDKTNQALGQLYVAILGLNLDLINTAEGFLGLLYEATNTNFNDQVAETKRVGWYLIACIIIVTLVAILLTWQFVMKKIFKVQKFDWYILQMIPIQLILGNKYIQQYLLKHSDGRFDNIKTYF